MGGCWRASLPAASLRPRVGAGMGRSKLSAVILRDAALDLVRPPPIVPIFKPRHTCGWGVAGPLGPPAESGVPGFSTARPLLPRLRLLSAREGRPPGRSASISRPRCSWRARGVWPPAVTATVTQGRSSGTFRATSEGARHLDVLSEERC